MNLKYRPDIDGLRAIAVLSVIVFHLNPHWLPGGFIGVDIFFVISGYLITKIIYTDIINQQFSFKIFYQRRINRILPVFFLVMFSTGLVAWWILNPKFLPVVFASIASTVFFVENIFFAKFTGGYWDASASQMPILHTWSLAVEEQFYIVLPFLLIFLFKLKINRYKILITLLIISLFSFFLAQISPFFNILSKLNYYSLITGRAGELLIGSIIGILSVEQSSRAKNYNSTLANSLTIVGFLMAAFSILFLSEENLFPSFWALIPTIGVAFVIFFHSEKNVVAKLLSIKPIVFIGTISYSLYLWHWPIIVLTKQYLLIDELTSINQYFLIIILMTSLSLLSFFFIEKPCRKYKGSFKFSLLTYYVIPSLIILSFSFAFIIEKKIEHKKILSKHPFLSEIVIPHRGNGYCFYDFNSIDNLKFNEKSAQHCLMGDKSKKPDVLLFGSSFAGMYDPFLDQVFKKNNLSYNSVSTNWCSPLLGGEFTGPKYHPAYEQCLSNRGFLKRSIEEKAYKTIIIADTWDRYSQKELELGLISFLEKAKEKSINVILLPSPRRFKIDPIPMLEANMETVNKFNLDNYLLDDKSNDRRIEEVVYNIQRNKGGGKILFINRHDLYNNDTPYFYINGYKVPYSLEGYHISKIGSLKLYDDFIKSNYYPYFTKNLLPLMKK